MSSRKSDWVDPDAAGPELLAPARSEGQPEERLRRTTKCNDWYWIPLWVAQMIVLMIVGFSAYNTYKGEMTAPPSSAVVKNQSAPSLNSNAFALVGVLILVALTFGLAFLTVVKKYAKQVIWCSLISFIVYLACLVVYYGVTRRYLAMAILAICLAIYIIWLYYVQDRIEFSSKVLSTVSKILHEFPSTFGVALGGLILQATWFITWLVLGVSIFYSMKIEFENGKPVSTSDKNPTKKVVTFELAMVLFVLLLSFFWTSQIIRNIVHVTISGVTATWYFLFPANMPAGNATLNALKRACTTSFGSIVLASLVNAFVNALRATVHIIRGWMMSEETSCITVAVMCCVECLLAMIEAIVEYVNSYALSYVAIYGKPYFESAKMTWDLMTRRGLDAVINDDIIGISLVMCSIVSGGVCAILAAILCSSSLLNAGGDWKIWAALGFILGLFLTYTVMAVIESSVITFFVCLADDPNTLKTTKRSVYDDIVPSMERKYSSIDLQPVNQGGARGNRSDQV